MKVSRGLFAVALAVLAAFGSATVRGAQKVHPIAAAATADPLIAAAGDIACDPSSSKFRNGNGRRRRASRRRRAISSVASRIAPSWRWGQPVPVRQHPQFQQSFDPSWGRFKAMIHPVPGDNEYDGVERLFLDAAGYFSYFGAAAGDSRGDSVFTVGNGASSG